LEQNRTILGIMYTWLLLGQESSAFELYHDLIDLNLKKTALIAAARGKLSDDLIQQIENLFVDLRRLSRRRAKIVHGTWCTAPTKRASILLVDLKHVNEKLNEMLRYVVGIMKDKTKVKPSISFSVLPDDYEEYHIRDFNALLTDLTAADQRAAEIGNKILARALELAGK
jgi:hypothetical protein